MYDFDLGSYLVTNFVPWGTAIDFVEVLDVPRLFSTTVSLWVSAHQRTVRQHVVFSGTKALVITGMDPYYRLYEGSSPPGTLMTPTRNVVFVSLTGTPGSYAMKASATIAEATYSGIGKRFKVSGSYYTLEELISAGPTVYTGTFATTLPLMDPDGVVPPGDVVDTAEDIVAALDSLAMRNYVMSMYVDSSPIPHELWEECGSDIIKQQKYVDGNMFLSMFELLSIKSLIKSMTNLPSLYKAAVASFSSFQRMVSLVRQLSDKELAYRYGVLPTISDMTKIGRAWSKWLQLAKQSNRVHSRRTSSEEGYLDVPILSTIVVTAEVAKLPTDPLGLVMESIQNLKQLGLYPNFETAWDAVPLSFLIDHAVNIGSTAEAIDTIIDTEYFPVRYVIYGSERSWSPSPARLWPYPGVTGNVEFILYDRQIMKELIVPPIHLDESQLGSRTWAELGMIAVQRLTK